MSNISPNEGYVHGGETPRQRSEFYDALVERALQNAGVAAPTHHDDNNTLHNEFPQTD